MTTEQEIIGEVKSGYTRPHGHKILLSVSGKWYYCILKHSTFHKFGEIYGKDKDLEGESINREALLNALQKQATILFIYPRVIYEVEAMKFYEWAYEHKTHRLTMGGETTYSVPLSIMVRHKRTYGN